MKYQLYIDNYRLWYLNDFFWIKLIFYDSSRMLQLSEFVWTLLSSLFSMSRFYLNDLFGIKFILLRSESNITTFWICMDASFFGMSRFCKCSPKSTGWNEISSDHHRYFFAVSLTPVIFHRTLPLNPLINLKIVWKLILLLSKILRFNDLFHAYSLFLLL